MKIIYLLLLFGIAYSSTNPDCAFDIYYNIEYTLLQYFDKKFTYYPFRLPVNANDKMDIEIKIPHNANHDFSLKVYEYNSKPSDYEILYHTGGTPKYAYQNHYINGKYTVYNYTYQVSPNAVQGSYFSIDITIPNYAYTEIYLTVNLAKYKYSNIKDLSFLTAYTIDTSIFGDGKIPRDYEIYIRLSSLSEDKMQIQLETHDVIYKDYAFYVDVCQFTQKPDESQVYYPYKANNCKNHLSNVATEKNKYYYDFQTEKNINYISIRIINNLFDLNYLNIYIHTEKGLQAYIIAIIVVAPILLIGGIIGGCYGKRRHDVGDVYDSGPIKV